MVLQRLVRSFNNKRFAKKWKNYPPEPFRLMGISQLWYDMGCPRKIGTEVEVAMQSGRVAVFRLVNVTSAMGVDWAWYHFDFVRYLSLSDKKI